LVETHRAKPERFLAKKGQALIWAANLMHGGTRQLDNQRTRWSQVTHYFFENCAYYTPMLSDPFYGKIDFRALTNIVTGATMPQRYAGLDIPQAFVEAVAGESQLLQYDFDPKLYLAANPDVAASGHNPAEHYLVFGIKEKRRLRP